MAGEELGAMLPESDSCAEVAGVRRLLEDVNVLPGSLRIQAIYVRQKSMPFYFAR